MVNRIGLLVVATAVLLVVVVVLPVVKYKTLVRISDIIESQFF